MSFVNYHTKEINCKIVYYGPGLGGKTTNIQYIYQKTAAKLKGEMVTLNTKNERTLFFDFIPLDFKNIRGFRVKFHVYTVPGQVFYEPSRTMILRGVDGVVFVADSQVERMEANLESFNELQTKLSEMSYKEGDVPIVMQWNKRDLPNIVSTQDLEEKLNKIDVPSFEACAINGQGVFETLKTISKLVLLNIKGGLE